MSFKFTSQKLLGGLFEPEGIYLTPPAPSASGEMTMLQGWGAHAESYGEKRYNGVLLKGHPGIDVLVAPGAEIISADAGRVVEISLERGGFERYIKVEHRWGESLYANIGEALVETGQSVVRGEPLARPAEPASPGGTHFLHFAIRIHPFNRYDGWGGFADPLPYLPPGSVIMPEEPGDDARTGRRTRSGRPAGDAPLHPMADDRPGMRRP